MDNTLHFFLTHFAKGYTLEHIVELLNNHRVLEDAIIYIKNKYPNVDKLSNIEIIGNLVVSTKLNLQLIFNYDASNENYSDNSGVHRDAGWRVKK